MVCIAVDPKAQGQGIGRELLEEIHKIVDADPNSLGIGLDTENKENISLYEKFGYSLTSKETLGEITIYTMFREKKK